MIFKLLKKYDLQIKRYVCAFCWTNIICHNNMTKKEFTLTDHEYIELNNLLKILSLVNSGGEAKIRINAGEVFVNGELETRKRAKLRPGDIVVFDNHSIVIR